MDKELIHYIVTYHTDLLTDHEKLGLKHLRSEIKIESTDNGQNKDDIERNTRLYKKIGWLTEDKEILDLIEGGQDTLDKKIAERILKDHKDKIVFNNCPKCGQLARTPSARQCRHCGHNWR
jgi:hypothetical protein